MMIDTLTMDIDADRLMADLQRLRTFGTFRTGVHRPTYSEVDIAARRWLLGRMIEAGLDAQIDGIGNVIGRSRAAGPRLLVGSHLESQNEAGWLDGAMGVIYGLELARTLGGGIDVVAWADEEGHYGSFLGSRSFIGELDEAAVDGCRNRYDGTPLRDALARCGLAGIARVRVDPGTYRGYLEAHIEQADDLERRGLRLGVVTSIVGIRQFRIRFEGVQNHAGTTRMAIRRDAGVAAVKLAGAIHEAFPKVCAERSVWTIGRMAFEPGAPSIIPGGAEMVLQFRDAEDAVLDRMEATLDTLVADAAKGPCGVTMQALSRSRPSIMADAFQDAIERACERIAPGLHQRMPSGAGHDAQVIARVMPAGMLFVPSIGGVSHHWSEDTADDDIVLGCRVLADAAGGLLGIPRSAS
jgi:N-carbamoyl-L-amino-acid hydrolase